MVWKRIKENSITLLQHSYAQYVMLGFITLLAAVLRFYKLGEWSFWIDEIFTINRAQVHYGSLDKILQNIPPAHYYFPISIILTGQFLKIFGVNELMPIFSTPFEAGILNKRIQATFFGNRIVRYILYRALEILNRFGLWPRITGYLYWRLHVGICRVGFHEGLHLYAR